MKFLARILQGSVAIVLAIAAVLWFASRRGDRGFIEEDVTINRPPAMVFRWISSEELVRRWMSNLVELRRADVGAPRGPEFRLVEVIQGRRTAMTVKVTRVVPNQSLALQVSAGEPALQEGFSSDAEFQLLGSGDYTRLIFDSHTKFVSLSDQIWEPVWTYASAQKMKDDLEKLKLLLEAEPANLRLEAGKPCRGHACGPVIGE